MQDNNTKPKIIKRIALVVLAVIVVALIAVGTVLILKNINPKTTNNINLTSAANIVSDYIKPDAITSLSSDKYQQQTNDSSIIGYKSSNQTYSVNIATKDSVLFYTNQKSESDDTKDIQNQTIAFMEQKGLNKIESLTAADKSAQYTTFADSSTVCQLIDYIPPTDSGMLPYHQISCADNNLIDQEYLDIEKLLSIYRESQTLSAFTQANKYTESKDGISYSVIFLTKQNSESQLLFAAVDNNWAYIGDLMAGDPKYSNAKYIITPEIQDKISDPKYNNFLIDKLLG